MPVKQKILSILDRARNAMDESYGGYEEPPYEAPPPPHFDSYSSYVPSAGQQVRSARYDLPSEYDGPDYPPRREYYPREATAYPGMNFFFLQSLAIVSKKKKN